MTKIKIFGSTWYGLKPENKQPKITSKQQLPKNSSNLFEYSAVIVLNLSLNPGYVHLYLYALTHYLKI